MGLAMLLNSAPGHLGEFAEVPHAIDNLAAIIRSSDDPDSKAIATSIFANLVSHASPLNVAAILAAPIRKSMSL